MKKITFLSMFLVMVAITTFSQSITKDLPAAAVIIHYKLFVGYNETTVLIFPSSVKQADRGERDLLIQKQAGVENVLKIKAARKDFTPTNLHIFTGDGRVYAFDVSYAVVSIQTTYDLSKLEANTSVGSNLNERIELTNKPLDTAELARNIAKVKAKHPFFSSHFNKGRMKVQLQTIYRTGDLLFLGIQVSNKSHIPYKIDFNKLYIQDNKRAKRSSIQQREIIPLYKDTLTAIPGNSAYNLVIVIPLMTVPYHRRLIWEMCEKNGGRNLSISISNSQLFRIRSL